MAKPAISKIIPFDATAGYVFSFSYIGNQPYKNRIVIRNALTNEIIKDETISEMRFRHPISGNILTNGTSYTIQISVFDENNNESSLSDKILFTCYSTPTFNFSGLNNETNYVKSSSYNATVNYSQKENRKLQSYIFYLYDATYNELSNSETIYNQTPTYIYSSLDNEQIYYLRCVGVTVDSVEIDTGFVKIYTQYNSSNFSGIFKVKNNYKGGYVQCISNIVSIDGVATDSYTILNGVLQFNNSNTFVEYNEGLLIESGHKVGIKAKNFKIGLIWSETNKVDKILLYHYIYEGLDYFKLDVSNGLSHYILYTPRQKLTANQFYTIYITRQDSLFKITIQ